MIKARIELILQVTENDAAAIDELEEFKRDIECGEFQRGCTKAGARKVTATFEWLKR